MSGGLGWRTRTNPPQSAGAMLSGCAARAPSPSPSIAHAISSVERRVRVEERVDRHHRRRRAGGAAAESARRAAAPSRWSAQRRAARQAPSAAPARRHRPCSASASRGSRPPSPGDRRRSSRRARAVPARSGRSLRRLAPRARNPSTSNPQATFETVAGANAVTTAISHGDRHCTGGGWLASDTRETRARNRTSD